MKVYTRILSLMLLGAFSLVGSSLSAQDYEDDLYYSPAKAAKSRLVRPQKKNGAKSKRKSKLSNKAILLRINTT